MFSRLLRRAETSETGGVSYGVTRGAPPLAVEALLWYDGKHKYAWLSAVLLGASRFRR